ncbi:juvenile hormone acid O-methyltransferase-like [Linepithema humile]|uniref:juvenile hormone acid O-methyltransferase-like n=1 Tax=Linepithema humile TaxID=83485 RepID=UPI0006236011|nr:PREDICTED: NADH dehydrogenase [ubiquinone] 1 alpha subcomplex assembly factor 5-like [Linepithema humile]
MSKKMADPEKYALTDDLQKSKVTNLIDEYADDLINMSGKCMDIGCGPGDITKELLLPALDSKAEIIGTDISQDMIDYANEQYNDKQLKFEVLDIQTKNLPKKYISEFDHIFSFHALHWCKDIRQAFENIYSMLRPNGTMLVLMVGYHDIFEVIQVLAKDDRYSSYIGDVKNYVSPYHNSKRPHKELKDLLGNIGFEVQHSSTREAVCSIDTKKFLTSIKSFISFSDNMPEDLAEEFKNDYIREYMERKIVYDAHHDCKNCTFVIDLYKLLVVSARKPDNAHK